MNTPSATRTRRLSAAALSLVLAGSLSACDAQQTAQPALKSGQRTLRSAVEVGQRTFGMGCGFQLDPVERKKPAAEPDPTKPVEMSELLRDTNRAFTYVNRFWDTHWSECFNFDYQEPHRFPNVKKGTSLACGKGSLEYDNAAYCADGHWVAIGTKVIGWGKKSGDMVVYVAVAHELGHGVQSQLRNTKYAHLIAKPQTKANELQADCLAGAALAGSSVEKDGFTWETRDAGEVNETYKLVGDLENIDNSTHGDAGERVSHFQHGREAGVSACFTWSK